VPAEGFAAGAPEPREIAGVLLAALAGLGLGTVLGPEAPLIALGGGLAVWGSACAAAGCRRGPSRTPVSRKSSEALHKQPCGCGSAPRAPATRSGGVSGGSRTVVSATFVPGWSSLKGNEGSCSVRDPYDGLTSLVEERGPALLATAVLLTGSRAGGEDLLQAALERLMRAWRRVSEDREAYLRRTMYHLAVDRWRLRRRRPEVVATVEPPTQSDGTDRYDLRDALIRALATLPPRQRAVLVLRYWEQLSEAEAASVLGCSVGTVKSSASRGLARLRSLATEWDLSAPNGARR
jgi:RNA polymerase sigma-70 factor (sigma-E family)